MIIPAVISFGIRYTNRSKSSESIDVPVPIEAFGELVVSKMWIMFL